jgi:peptidoglycan/LPS O-acetylase OafA/YrhL
MSKNFLFKLLVGLIILAGPVLWLLSIVTPDTFGWFNLSYCVAMVSLGIGLLLLLRGVFKKDNILYKKFNIWLGIGLLVVTLFSIASAIALPDNWIVPIICVLVAAGIVLGIIGTGGKKWDTADNQKVGYKNYHQRKAEEEKNNKE